MPLIDFEVSFRERLAAAGAEVAGRPLRVDELDKLAAAVRFRDHYAAWVRSYALGLGGSTVEVAAAESARNAAEACKWARRMFSAFGSSVFEAGAVERADRAGLL